MSFEKRVCLVPVVQSFTPPIAGAQITAFPRNRSMLQAGLPIPEHAAEKKSVSPGGDTVSGCPVVSTSGGVPSAARNAGAP